MWHSSQSAASLYFIGCDSDREVELTSLASHSVQLLSAAHAVQVAHA
jgi:hypothetical protein